MGAAAGANRAAPPGTLGLPSSTSGLGVMGTGESLFAALASGSPSPSADKRRLSFFSYADILNENKGEVMDLQGVVRHAAERDEQQHGLFHPQAYAAHSQEASNGYEAFTLQPSILQQLGGASMARSASTSAAANPRTSSMPGGVRSASGSSSVAGGGAAGSGAYTPARGRRENHLENRALSNRLDSLHLATSNAATVAAEPRCAERLDHGRTGGNGDTPRSMDDSDPFVTGLLACFLKCSRFFVHFCLVRLCEPSHLLNQTVNTHTLICWYKYMLALTC